MFLYSTVENISKLHKLGLRSFFIICDNNQVIWILLCSEAQLLFLLYDTVHIFKNIRNNWINQKKLAFNFPDFENPYIVKSADFDHLRLLYIKEQNKLLSSVTN